MLPVDIAVQRPHRSPASSSTTGPPARSTTRTQQAVACEDRRHTKYLLDVAKVHGTDVVQRRRARSTQTGQLVVGLTFTGDGRASGPTLTSEAYNNTGDQRLRAGQHSATRAAAWSRWCWTTGGLRPGDPGRADQRLADHRQLQPGPARRCWPTSSSTARCRSPSSRSEAQTSPPRWAPSYLRAGLLAVGIGMLLVIIYAFFYYRLLGSVIFCSLVLSGLLTFGTLVLLGRQIGFTLTLAGIAGLHRLARCRGRLVRHLLRTTQGRDPGGSKPTQRGAAGLGPGPAHDHHRQRGDDPGRRRALHRRRSAR